jgi:uncharacterized protein (DUF488 family)
MLSIGHSNRPLREFLDMLKAHGVELLVDIRTIPRSRYNPQFNRETLPQALAAEGIAYEHMPGLGGLRHPQKGSPNTGWKNASFRGYADYMQTEEFRQNLEKLVSVSEGSQTAIMCAEAVPWRCHRLLVADALTVRGISVSHIMSMTKADLHRLTPFARVRGKQVIYPATDPELFSG